MKSKPTYFSTNTPSSVKTILEPDGFSNPYNRSLTVAARFKRAATVRERYYTYS